MALVHSTYCMDAHTIYDDDASQNCWWLTKLRANAQSPNNIVSTMAMYVLQNWLLSLELQTLISSSAKCSAAQRDDGEWMIENPQFLSFPLSTFSLSLSIVVDVVVVVVAQDGDEIDSSHVGDKSPKNEKLVIVDTENQRG